MSLNRSFSLPRTPKQPSPSSSRCPPANPLRQSMGDKETFLDIDHSKSDGEQVIVATPVRQQKNRELKRQPVLDEASDSGSDETDIWDLDVCRKPEFHKLLLRQRINNVFKSTSRCVCKKRCRCDARGFVDEFLDKAPLPSQLPKKIPEGAHISDYYHVNELVGQGTWGKVYDGDMHSDDDTTVPDSSESPRRRGRSSRVQSRSRNEESNSRKPFLAIKKTTRKNFTSADKSTDVMGRVWMHAMSNVVQYVDFLQDEQGNSYEVMELCSGPELSTYVTRRGHLDETHVVDLAKQMLEALDGLHRRAQLIHRDVKPENFKFSSMEAGARLILLDLGLAEKCNYLIEADYHNGECDYERHPRRDTVGSLNYAAPEIFDHLYGPAIDMFSLGCTLYFMLVGRHLFSCSSNDEYRLLIWMNSSLEKWDTLLEQHLNRSRLWQKVSPLGQDFVKSLLNKHPAGRPTAQACLRSPWFQFPVGAMRPVPAKPPAPAQQQRQPVLTQPKELTFQLSF